MSCTGPTLYPVVLSSIDGECVFAEYDLSTAVNVTNWQNIHDVVMWCCPWLYYDPPNDATTPGPMPKGVIKPNNTVPANTTTVWMSDTGGIGNSTFPGGQGYVNHSNQFIQLAGGAEGVGTTAYWAEVNPSHEALFYLELGNEVETSAAPAKITLAVSSLSGGPSGVKLDIDPSQTVSYSGTGDPVAGWGIAGSSKWSYKLQPANNRSLESLVNVKSSATSAATTGQVFTFNGTRWQASAAPAGGGSFALSDATDTTISTDNMEPGDLLVYDFGRSTWENVHSVRIGDQGGDAIISARMVAGQTSAVFTASNSGGDEVFKMDGTGNFKVSGTVSAAIVSGTEGTFVTVTGIDHGGLGGLSDDDHSQYHNDTRGDTRYYRKTQFVAEGGESGAGQPILLDEAGQLDAAMIDDGDIDHGSIAGLGDDDHTQYTLVAGTRAFTGAQAGVAFGATEGVSGATVSGTTVEGQTVYAPSVSGATVSATEGKFLTVTGIDHGGLGGLGDDDHTQYHNDTRGDVRYNLKTDLASTADSKGASLIGIEDDGTYTSVTDVEAAIQEIYPTIPTSTWSRYIAYAEQPITWNGSTSFYSNPGVSNASNKQRATAGRNMTNSNEYGHVFQIIVPPELDVTAVLTATVYGRMGAAGSGNVEIEWSGGAQTDNEYMGTGATTTGAVVKDVSSYGNNDSIQIALGTVWNADTLVEGDILHMTIFRDATSGNSDDTFANTVQYMGIELTGTRKAAF